MSRLQNRLDRSLTALTGLLPGSRANEPETTSRVDSTHTARVIAARCSCCHRSKTTIETTYWDGTLDHLRSAADEGCIRCSFLAKCIVSFASDIFQKQNSFRAWANFSTCELKVHRNGKPDNFVLDIFALHEQNNTPFNNIPIKRLLPGDTSSDMTSITIANWIQDCKSNHTDCNSIIPDFHDTSYSPKRLLDLTNARIVLRENVPGRPVYACLSHCWGRSNDLTKTTLENIDEFKTLIPWKDLTKTFRDAVEICRRAEINFLWIDSLCIIQGCKDDWDEQAPQMASIYRSAFVTIAATNSKETIEGCYRTAGADYLAKCVPGTDVYVRRQPSKFPTHWASISSEEWPLLNRGWIYQEMRLSRRVLHFCSQEVIWECQNARRSESGCSDKPLGSKDTQTYKTTMYGAVPYSKLAEDPRKLWYRTVQDYSRLQLTFEKDKMPALAALTRDMETLRADDRFLAGLWEKTLLLDLLWMVWPSPKTGRLATWRAPTWSWACVQSQVMWGSSVDHVLESVKVDDIRYVTTGPACMGEIQEASISLHVPLLRAKFDSARFESARLCWDPITPFLYDLVIQDEKMDYDFSLPGPCNILSPTEVFIAPIGINKLNCHHTGIVLRKQDRSIYERVGYAEIQHREVVDMFDKGLRGGRGMTWSFSVEGNEKLDLVTTFFMSIPVCSVTII
ncbi:HET-domain-containing protein [Karstenula rhodostoma CBS 690.94]|uniref:HET-domain-containing protein n=1 Tax=Karstenula rhodostoma CBS 690.94 TaxID=1392251 RepID=A0A9P4UJD0_9PLEO|nr:HET-domain-containing protein [Karstenula rhodostoma CBS 690.94]